MSDQDLIISDLSGGRNGVDAPASDKFPPDQCFEALNVDFRNGGLGRRRGGMYNLSANVTGTTITMPVFSLARHVPSGDETQCQMFTFEGLLNYRSERLALPGLAAWTVNTNYDPPLNSAAMSAENIATVSFNGKLFLFYKSANDRLKVYDPLIDAIRDVGLRPPTLAPTAANTGSGSYPAVGRYYRARFGYWDGSGRVVRLSEPSPASALATPSGTGGGALVTAPSNAAFPGEKENGWQLEASGDGVNWYIIATKILYPTTTYVDTFLVGNYPTFPLSRVVGTYTLVPSARFGCTDGNRLIIANIFEQSKGSRVMWTPVLGSLDEADDERLFQTATIKPFLDLDEKNGGDLTGIGQINGVIYAFKWRQIWRLSPTGDVYAPYSARRLSSVVGAVSHKSIALGEDAVGQPALYFMSQNGPYRVGPNGLEYIGRDLEDLTRTDSGLSNLNTVATVKAHAVFHMDQFQYWLWFAIGLNDTPRHLCVLDVKKTTRRDEYGVRGGWTHFDGPIATAVCSAMGPYILGVQTATLRPWVSMSSTPPKIAICDRDDLNTDLGTPFQAYITTRSVGPFGRLLRVGETTLMARHHTPTTGVTIRQTLIADFGREVNTADVLLEAALPDRTLIRRVQASAMADAAVLQIQIGDASAVDVQWEMRQLKVPVFVGGDI